jgi:hypothetical protein
MMTPGTPRVDSRKAAGESGFASCGVGLDPAIAGLASIVRRAGGTGRTRPLDILKLNLMEIDGLRVHNHIYAGPPPAPAGK